MKKSTLAFAASLLACMLLSLTALSQGCVAIRNLAGFGQFTVPQYDQEPVKWLVAVNSRYSEFNDTYSGSNNLNLSQEDQTFSRTVIIDLTVAKFFENGWSVAVDIPFMSVSRKNWQDHGADKIKHTTHSFGLSDIRIAAYKWLFDVTEPHRGNIQVGLGLKFATGDYQYQDYFYRPEGKVVAPVNLTVQLGDGGTGITTELNAFYTLSKTISLYANGFYLFNPRDQTGVSSTMGRAPTEVQKEAGIDVISVPDAFLFRGGANFTMSKWLLWGGIRFEGSPVYDAFGGSNGQRRAGYAVSIEPGLNYKFKNSTFFVFVPLPVYRTTKQTAGDKAVSQITGVNTPSPGGMTNALVFLGVIFRI